MVPNSQPSASPISTTFLRRSCSSSLPSSPELFNASECFNFCSSTKTLPVTVVFGRLSSTVAAEPSPPRWLREAASSLKSAGAARAPSSSQFSCSCSRAFVSGPWFRRRPIQRTPNGWDAGAPSSGLSKGIQMLSTSKSIGRSSTVSAAVSLSGPWKTPGSSRITSCRPAKYEWSRCCSSGPWPKSWSRSLPFGLEPRMARSGEVSPMTRSRPTTSDASKFIARILCRPFCHARILPISEASSRLCRKLIRLCISSHRLPAKTVPQTRR
mmetsp:Transcript_92666/g.271273  ORF Transcript_92666/g.271273 Transcript_92666/m.271273 type:complete len:269 (+) Transcript_92666:61-867(+)